ncbi:unnamed protein product [Adineta steineri]|uniref:EF-hand domain-containing protein n=1 Tax=Adineta steineri TaxID=433720 RepID=A0A814G9Y6_9BILA|nr:unnamed protein product [Adineta steineri]CAF3877693.1 unnamed protein product [Adineta steineri]CAF4088693.1 unnamed protein product [Adineta steineri]
MRAYKKADKSGNGYIEFKEFATLISQLNYYDEIINLFRELDIDNDHRISFNEFKKGYDLLNLNSSNTCQLRKEFDSIDTNQSGYIVFDEFCFYMTERMGFGV